MDLTQVDTPQRETLIRLLNLYGALTDALTRERLDAQKAGVVVQFERSIEAQACEEVGRRS